MYMYQHVWDNEISLPGPSPPSPSYPLQKNGKYYMRLKSSNGPVNVLVINDEPPAQTTPTTTSHTLSPLTLTSVPNCTIQTSSEAMPTNVSADIEGVSLLSQQTDLEQRQAVSLDSVEGAPPTSRTTDPPSSLNSALTMEEFIQDVIGSIPINPHQAGKGSEDKDVPMEGVEMSSAEAGGSGIAGGGIRGSNCAEAGGSGLAEKGGHGLAEASGSGLAEAGGRGLAEASGSGLAKAGGSSMAEGELGSSSLADAMDLSEFGSESSNANAVLAALKSLVAVMNEQEQQKQEEAVLGAQHHRQECRESDNIQPGKIYSGLPCSYLKCAWVRV